MHVAVVTELLDAQLAHELGLGARAHVAARLAHVAAARRVDERLLVLEHALVQVGLVDVDGVAVVARERPVEPDL